MIVVVGWFHVTVVAAMAVLGLLGRLRRPSPAKACQRPQVGGLREHRCGCRGLAVRDVQGAARLQPIRVLAP